MKVGRWLPVVAALSLALGACGDGKDAAVLAPEDLGAGLLTAADVGTGFTEGQRLVMDTRSEEAPPVLDPGMWCAAAGNVADELLALVGDGGAFIELRSPDVAGRNYHGVSEQLWSGPDAAAFLERATTGFEACVGQTWALDEEGTASVQALAGAVVGDDSTMALVTYVTPGPDGDYAWRGRTLVARLGTTVMVIQELDVQLVDSEPRFTDADWQRLVDVAAVRVEALTGG